MPVTCCYHHAKRILALPEADWKAEVEALADECAKPGQCTGPQSCREQTREFLRTEWKRRRNFARWEDDRA